MTTTTDKEMASKLEGYSRRFESVLLTRLSVDPRVQQPLREGKITDILRRGYDPALVGTIVVSERDSGQMVVLDGQHRAESARRSSAVKIDALVWSGLSLAQEAWLFTYLNRKSNPVAMSTFKTRSVAGEDIPIQVTRVLSDWGWTVSGVKNSDGQFAAVGEAERIYRGTGMYRGSEKLSGPRVFARAIETITCAWGLNKNGGDGYLLGGIALFLIRYWDSVDQGKLVKALSRSTPRAIRAEARGFGQHAGVHIIIAHAYRIHHEYNKSTRTKLLPFTLA